MGRASIVGVLNADLNARPLDDALGPIGWRRDFEEAGGPQRPTAAAIETAKRFGESVRIATGRRNTAVPVRQRPDQMPESYDRTNRRSNTTEVTTATSPEQTTSACSRVGGRRRPRRVEVSVLNHPFLDTRHDPQ